MKGSITAGVGCSASSACTVRRLPKSSSVAGSAVTATMSMSLVPSVQSPSAYEPTTYSPSTRPGATESAMSR